MADTKFTFKRRNSSGSYDRLLPKTVEEQVLLSSTLTESATIPSLPAAGTGLDKALRYITKMIRLIIGGSDWTSPPPISIVALSSRISGTIVIPLSGALLTRVINGTTSVPRSLLGGANLVNGVTQIADTQGTLGFVTSYTSSSANVQTLVTSMIGTDEPTLLGNVSVSVDGSAGLPQTSADAVTIFGRSVSVGDYAKTIYQSGVVVEWYITAIGASGNITWGNAITINTSDYQAQTTAADAGKVLTGGATAGTYGTSRAIDTAPTAGSSNLITSGAVKTAIPTVLDSLVLADKVNALSANAGYVLQNSKVNMATGGTWTPILTENNNSTVSMVSGTYVGSYIKLGNVIFYRAHMSGVVNKETSGYLFIYGLPYPQIDGEVMDIITQVNILGSHNDDFWWVTGVSDGTNAIRALDKTTGTNVIINTSGQVGQQVFIELCGFYRTTSA